METATMSMADRERGWGFIRRAGLFVCVAMVSLLSCALLLAGEQVLGLIVLVVSLVALTVMLAEMIMFVRSGNNQQSGRHPSGR